MNEAETLSPDGGYPIGSVDNALRVLESFAQGAASIRVADASRGLGVARSTAHRLLQVLAGRGFLAQDPQSRAYHIGPALIRLAVGISRSLDLATVARPAMAQVVETVGETVHLVVLHGADAFFVESIETTRGLRVGGRAGQLLPAYATASGRVLLAELGPEEVHRLLPAGELPRRTSRTVTDPAGLARVLADTRERGYATSFGESEDEVFSVAVPIRRRGGDAVAALAIGAPPSRLAPDDVPRVVSVLQESVDRLMPLLP